MLTFKSDEPGLPADKRMKEMRKQSSVAAYEQWDDLPKYIRKDMSIDITKLLPRRMEQPHCIDVT